MSSDLDRRCNLSLGVIVTSFRVLPALVLAAVAMVMSGCSPSDGYPIFLRPAESSDTLPAHLATMGDLQDLDLATSRLAASFEDVDFYLVETNTSGGVCVAIDAGDDNDSVACSGRNALLGTSGLFGSIEVADAPIGEREGWTVISENIRIQN